MLGHPILAPTKPTKQQEKNKTEQTLTDKYLKRENGKPSGTPTRRMWPTHAHTHSWPAVNFPYYFLPRC